MAGFRGRTSVDKQLLKNVIRHTESMNKVHEESEMWRQYKEMQTRRKDTSPYRSGQMRSDRNVDTRVKTSGGVSPGSSYWTKKLYEAEEADPDRWGHGGFKELYPDAFSSSSSTEGSEDRSRSKRRKKKKKAKKKDVSKKRKHSGDSDSSVQQEKRKMSKKRKRKKRDDDKKTKLTSNGTHSGKKGQSDQQSSSIFIPAHPEKSVRHRPKHKQSRKAERDHSPVDADSSRKRRRGDGNAKIRDRKRHSDDR
ncbi:C11orf57 [Branchiostoma lanceolatum]|uniref:C11orf57 protein n=1 Tax=Branchiostoma lanceolatum TaxID=7740 RepID=A0A8J9ZS84_BRALA|nr:C11orf57 [Branchiostoma lanceolatum]